MYPSLSFKFTIETNELGGVNYLNQYVRENILSVTTTKPTYELETSASSQDFTYTTGSTELNITFTS